ncbi:MAG: hypothetical protein MnENMB40S_00520 [Rhizobiaceae bacterium MnEN-MB40S]|nr:MAG: hypothetical protein MnENMB40S_00520 [Rhizobiaceae bacterium MnEN-MB40S]
MRIAVMAAPVSGRFSGFVSVYMGRSAARVTMIICHTDAPDAQKHQERPVDAYVMKISAPCRYQPAKATVAAPLATSATITPMRMRSNVERGVFMGLI